ncbi:MAG: prepilin-type N-terminal cleavage/methylation domain-containing protein [Bdellovibrio sp.]|nr:prepilin-type N-terminal cleavage/methylation domain-containing protein [Bdellovibrio sp.]
MKRIINGNSCYGFTLMEVMISIFLLVVISIAVSQTVTNTYKIREIIMNEGDFYNSIRLSVGILDRDISMLYSPTILLKSNKTAPTQHANHPTPPSTNPQINSNDQYEMEEVLASDLGLMSQFWTPAVHKSGLRPSRFIGAEQKLSFVSVSHIRIYKDSLESEFAKITYELKQDKEIEGAMVLVKGESTNVFEDDETKDKSWNYYPLLHGITKFKLRYFQKDKSEWLNSWDNEKEEFKEIYPDRIEVQLEVKGPTRLQFEGVYHFKPEIPLRGLDAST